MGEFTGTFAIFGSGVLGRWVHASGPILSPGGNATIFLLSGGTSNPYEESSIGGEISFKEASITLFSDILTSPRNDIIDYRCIYIKNVSTVDFNSFEIFIEDQTGEGSIIRMGLGGNVNDTAFLLSNPLSIPPDVSFSFAPIPVGDFAVGDYIPLWVQRTTPKNAQFTIESNTARIGVRAFY